jgi:DNA-binding NtrC family response regulator
MFKNKISILVVDDAADTLEILQRNLSSKGYKVFVAGSVSEAIEFLEKTSVDLVITDLKMPNVDGLDLVRHVRANLKDTEIMMITGYATIEGAVKAVKTGAEEFLPKPFTEEELYEAVRRSLEKLHVRRAAQSGTESGSPRFEGIIGDSPAVQGVYRIMEKAAMTSATVLITGESGTGKELVARAIHYRSRRASAPFVPVNCGGIPEGLLESELFGHVKGSFTGALEARAGFFQTAEGGTIFLDEISETSLSMQVKLLRVLQNGEVCMVGSSKIRRVDARIIAATNKDLQNLVRKGIVREDLFFRLSVLTIAIPPLRERGDDILLLARHFSSKYSKEYGKQIPHFTDAALEVLRNYNWPGNIRELENLIHRIVVLYEDGPVDVPDFPAHMRFAISNHANLNQSLAEVEGRHIRNVLVSVKGNKTKAARILGIDRKTLREKLRELEPGE